LTAGSRTHSARKTLISWCELQGKQRSLRAARSASEEHVASAIFAAATDGANQLRFVATQDIVSLMKARRETSEQHYIAFMRSNFM
jgi:hypothetical protein